MEENDEDLIKYYLNGDQNSFKLIVDRYTPSIYNFSVRFVGVGLAPDIVQEVFIKIWKNLNKFDIEKAHFKTWLWTIVRNTTTDYLRKKKMVLFSDLDNNEEQNLDNMFVDDAILPDEALQKLQDKEFLNKLLDQMSPVHREVLILYYQEEMTFSEIGDVLGSPMNTIKSHHRRALNQLKKMVL